MIVLPRDLSRLIGAEGSSAATNRNVRHCFFKGLEETASPYKNSAWRLSDIVTTGRVKGIGNE